MGGLVLDSKMVDFETIIVSIVFLSSFWTHSTLSMEIVNEWNVVNFDFMFIYRYFQIFNFEFQFLDV